MAFDGIPWFSIGFDDFAWFLIGFDGFPWFSIGFGGFPWFSIGFATTFPFSSDADVFWTQKLPSLGLF